MIPLPISGLLPIHNGSQWINKSLPTILNSLGTLDELVVIDDGSTDKTFETISEFVKKDARIVIHRFAHSGLVSSLNMGLKLAKNNWIARFDIDDLYPSDRLVNQRSLILKNENVGAIFSDYNIWKQGEYFRGRIPSPIFALQTKLSLVNSQRTAHPSALLNRELVNEVGGYLQEEFPTEDLGLWSRLTKVSQLITSEHVGLEYNRRFGSISNSMRAVIMTRKAHLIQGINFSKAEIELLIQNVNELLSAYDSYPLEDVRKFLFSHDYLTFLSVTRDSSLVKARRGLAQRLKKSELTAVLSPATIKFGAQSLQRKFERVLER